MTNLHRFLIVGIFIVGFFFAIDRASAAPLSGLNADLDGVIVATTTATTVDTTAANDATANDVRLLTDPGSTAYFGMNYFFNQLSFNIGTAGTVGVATWEYCSAASATCTTWTALSPTDNTDSFKTAGTNSVTFSASPTPAWVTSAVYDGVLRYYVRARTTTAYTVEPLATQISAIEFNMKVKVRNELNTNLTGLLDGAFTVSACTTNTKFAFREIADGSYELALGRTLDADLNCDYTVTSSGYVASSATSTGALSSTLTDKTASPERLLYAYKVTAVQTEATTTLTTVTAATGDDQSVSCTESGGAWYCAVPVSHTGLRIRVQKDGYVSASTSLFTTDRTAESGAQVTGTATNTQFALKVSATDENGNVVGGAAVTAGDSGGVTCTEGASGLYFCAIPLAHTGTTATLSKSGYITTSGTYTDRAAGLDAQSVLSLINVRLAGGGGSAPILSASASVNPSSVNVGGQVVYAVTLSNTGGQAAENVTVKDTLPAGFTFTDGTSAKTVSTIAVFVPGPSRVVSYTANVGSAVQPGTYTNSVVVMSGSGGPTLYANAPVTVVAGPVPPSPTPSPSPSPSSGPTPSATATPSPLPQPYGEKAAVTLYRIEGDPRVYAVVNNQRRHIPSPKAFAANGFAWGTVKVYAAADAPQYAEAKLLRAVGDTKVYLIKGGVKIWIKTAQEFVKAGYRWEDILDVPVAEVEAYAVGGGNILVLVEGVTALNVRNAPALTGTRLGRILSNQEVENLGVKNGWYHVRIGALEGWASARYLKDK